LAACRGPQRFFLAETLSFPKDLVETRLRRAGMVSRYAIGNEIG
jgi:hypothetical protein